MTIYLTFWLAALVFASFMKERWAQIAFGIVAFLIIGFRYETGFDWPIYKRAFDFMAVDFSIDAILTYSRASQIELGWLAITSLVSQIFSDTSFCKGLFRSH